MKYSLNEYLPYISDSCARIEVYSDRELAAKLISEYKRCSAEIIPLYKVLEHGIGYIPNASAVIHAMREYAKASQTTAVFVGIEAYLALLRREERKDFLIGLSMTIIIQRLFSLGKLIQPKANT